MDMSHLKQLLAQHNITQTGLARILGRDKSVVTNLFQGKRQLKADEAALIAAHIGVPVARIIGLVERTDSGFMEPPMLIPFQHEPEHCRKSANVVKKDGKFYLEAAESSYSPKAYALEAQDDSMNLSGILPGDIVISELDRACKPGQIVIAQHYQGQGAKTITRRYQPPFLMPHSTQAAFKPISLEKDEARLVSPVLRLVRMY